MAGFLRAKAPRGGMVGNNPPQANFVLGVPSPIDGMGFTSPLMVFGGMGKKAATRCWDGGWERVPKGIVC